MTRGDASPVRDRLRGGGAGDDDDGDGGAGGAGGQLVYQPLSSFFLSILSLSLSLPSKFRLSFLLYCESELSHYSYIEYSVLFPHEGGEEERTHGDDTYVRM